MGFTQNQYFDQADVQQFRLKFLRNCIVNSLGHQLLKEILTVSDNLTLKILHSTGYSDLSKQPTGKGIFAHTIAHLRCIITGREGLSGKNSI